MMTNNYFPNQYNTTYGYAAPRPQARNTQPLTPEQIAKLRQDGKAFDMKVDVEDLWKAACTHKEKNGNSTLIQNPDGSYTCTICHETFNMCDCTKEEIEEAVKKLCDMLQTSKTVYLDAPDELILQYYQMLPLLKKFPDLWERAINNFSMYEGTLNGTVTQMTPGYSGFAAMQTLLTNPYAGFGGMAPQAGYPAYQQPMAQQAPAYNGFGYAPAQQPVVPTMDPAYNPMAYGAPQQPMAPAPGVIPGAVQPAPVPATPAPTAPVNAAPANTQGEVQQQATFNV